MSDLVLATDVTTHIPFMKSFNEDVAAGNVSATQAMHVVLKAADISNPAKVPALQLRWTRRVMTEFFLQGDLEKSLRLPVTPPV